MKILELRFKNLNSLYGEWLIDFSDPVYLSNGIFALIGPTGAGKSTILDAICLALYGATPRLGKITKSENEIMSRQSGECYAEVLFESQSGRFRCHWQQRCARKRAGGNLQDQEHQIADADTGKLIESKKSLVAKVVEEKTGMDFDRFTRSMLLAQGGFDTFLKANIEQKSKILEQITGTEIYSEISRRVHEYQWNEQEKLKQLQAETSGIVILEKEQEGELRQELELKQKQEIDLMDKSTTTAKASTWLSSIDSLKKDISKLTEEAVQLQNDVDTFRPERSKLDRAIRAAALAGPQAMLTAIRKQHLEDQAKLKTDETSLPKLEYSANSQTEALKLAEQQTIKAKEKLKVAAELIQKIRLLDQKLIEQKKAILGSEESCKREAIAIAANRQCQLQEYKKRTKAEKNLEFANSYLKEHRQDEWLLSTLAVLEEQFGNLLSKQKELAQKEIELKTANRTRQQAVKKLDDSSKQSSRYRQELEELVKKIQQGEDRLSEWLDQRLLREYRSEKETLLREMAYIRKIVALEDHRAKLEDGKACPLCGAHEHPFAEGNMPLSDITEKKIEVLTKLIAKAEDLETANKKLKQAETMARKNLTDGEKLEASAANAQQTAEKTLVDLKAGQEQLRSDFSELKQALSAKLKPLGIMEIPDDDVSSLLAALKVRLHSWQEQLKKKLEVEQLLSSINSEIKSLDAVIASETTALLNKEQPLETLKREQAAGSDRRKELYGDNKPDDEENRLNLTLAEAENSEKKARVQNSWLQQSLISVKTNIASLKKRLGESQLELAKALADFLSALALAGFADEEQFLEAKLAAEQRQALATRVKQLDERQTDLKARKKDREMRLMIETAKNLSDKTFDELELQLKEQQESLQELRNAIATLKHQLSENTAAKERIRAKQSAIDAQKKEYQRWKKLHILIGSADGKKYRNFAQGLTFELMVAHANRQLEKMTDRYLLIRDEQQPLELNVVDNYQAGEIRSTKNLSGGESFTVSLTLALGLSKMASRKVRVDSLFLDEGFGSLDEVALESALETLSNLQQDGKLIGIISHVAALKERISTQITITPISGGRSSLAGPGCNKVVKHKLKGIG